MSVMVIKPESCAKIADYICKGETEGQKEKVFIELRVANINEWNKNYPESLVGILEAVEMLETYKPDQFDDSIQALKSIQCWKYNSDRTSPIWERVDEFLRQNFKCNDTNTQYYKNAKWE